MHLINPLILDESPEWAGAIAVIDAPRLVTAALERSDDVRVWCDDLRDAQAVSEIDPDLLASHPGELRGVDLVWGHLPKPLAALDEHCAGVRGAPDVMFLSGAGIGHMGRSVNQVLARHFAAINTNPGRSKYRVLRAWGPNQLETEWPKVCRHPDLGLVLVTHGATFNGNRIDDGTRLLLDHLDPGKGTALGLRYGNGAIAAALIRRELKTTVIDVSWSAMAATCATAQTNGLDIEVRWADGLSSFPDHSFDVIATNPPFHRRHAKELASTLRMFDEAARVLRPDGQLWCVFDSHLPWRRELATRIGWTRVVAQGRNYQLTFINLWPTHRKRAHNAQVVHRFPELSVSCNQRNEQESLMTNQENNHPARNTQEGLPGNPFRSATGSQQPASQPGQVNPQTDQTSPQAGQVASRSEQPSQDTPAFQPAGAPVYQGP